MTSLIAVFLLICYVKGEILIPIASKLRPHLSTCVSGIINNHHMKDITYVDFNSDEDILQGMTYKDAISIVSRDARVKLGVYNENYLIQAGNVSDLIINFQCLRQEAAWQPTVKFIIILNEIETDLRAIFNTLLKFHVINALVIDATDDNHLYTYNPFENYGCGKRYDRIISLGKCLQRANENLFPDKLVTGLRNCTFNVEAYHWPPYVIHPGKYFTMGVEQFILKVLASIEDFKLNYTYTDRGENFSTVDANMTVTGPLKSLQDNVVDITIGGMVVKEDKAEVFDIIWSHIPYVDEVVYIVKKTDGRYTWQYTFVEFSVFVWFWLIISFVVYAFIAIKILRVQDTSLFVLNMFGALLLHGMKVRRNASRKFVYMCWSLFAFLVSALYVCSLTSLTTHSLPYFQISNEQDLVTYNLKACVSPMMQHVTRVNKMTLNVENLTEGCKTLHQSMKTVSRRDDAYTVNLKAVYYFYKHEFCDEISCKLFEFRRPINKILYAIYLYKGFPMLDKLHSRVMHLRESGLASKAAKIVYLARSMKNKVYRKKFQAVVLVPLHALVYGYISSIIVFVMEIIVSRLYRLIK